jgi:hypothetical protein
MNDAKTMWFAKRRFGWGAGMPIAWQGWAVLGAFLAVVTLAVLLVAPRSQLWFGIIVIAATVPLSIVAFTRTQSD